MLPGTKLLRRHAGDCKILLTFSQTYNPISDERTLQSYALDVLHGLIEIHSHNVIHCDLKPQNFLIFYNENENVIGDQADSEYITDNVSVNSYDSNSFVKISDFGFSHIIPYGETKAYMKFKTGTFSYTAPEIANVICFKQIFTI